MLKKVALGILVLVVALAFQSQVLATPIVQSYLPSNFLDAYFQHAGYHPGGDWHDDSYFGITLGKDHMYGPPPSLTDIGAMSPIPPGGYPYDPNGANPPPPEAGYYYIGWCVD